MTDSSLLGAYDGFFDLSLTEISARYSIDPAKVNANRSYGNLSGLSMIEMGGESPCMLYFKDNRLVLLYISGSKSSLSVSDLKSAYGNGVKHVPSRAGKVFNHYVAAENGVAWSDNGKKIAFIEMFNRTTFEAWKTDWYKDSGPFYK